MRIIDTPDAEVPLSESRICQSWTRTYDTKACASTFASWIEIQRQSWRLFVAG
jgi:hypothetical protein